MTDRFESDAAGWFHRRTAPGNWRGLWTQIIDYSERGTAPVLQREGASLDVPLIVSFADPFAIAFDRAPTPADATPSFASGLYAGPVNIRSNGKARCLQINFTPLGARRFFGLPMSTLAGTLVTVDALSDRGIGTLAARLAETRDWRSRLDLAQRFVVARLTLDPPASGPVEFAYAVLARTGGRLPIQRLADRLEWSRKHLLEKFRAEVGIGPKALARIMRYQRALALARTTERPDWAQIALQCGYADQPHLIREFKALGGFSPGAMPG